MADKSLHFSKKGILGVGLFLLCAILIPELSFTLRKYAPADDYKFRSVPAPKYLQLMRGGFKSLLADFYYIRGILDLSESFNDYSQRVDWLLDNFRAAVYLDPQLIQAYFFGGMVVVREKKEIKKGIAFLEEGLTLSPWSWEIPYWIGFDYYQLGDYLKAIEYYKKAGKFAEAPNFLKSNPAMLYYKAGKAGLGIMYLEGLLESIKDEKQFEWIELKLNWLKGIVILEQGIGRYQKQYGRLPKNIKEMVSAGIINQVPVDPFGQGYYLDPESGEIKSRFGPSEADLQKNPTPPPDKSPSCSKCKQ